MKLGRWICGVVAGPGLVVMAAAAPALAEAPGGTVVLANVAQAPRPVAPTIRIAVDMASVGADLDRSRVVGAPTADGPESRTAIDYRLPRNGLFGQVGYFCRADASPIENAEAAVRTDAKDDRLLGATIRYAF